MSDAWKTWVEKMLPLVQAQAPGPSEKTHDERLLNLVDLYFVKSATEKKKLAEEIEQIKNDPLIPQEEKLGKETEKIFDSFEILNQQVYETIKWNLSRGYHMQVHQDHNELRNNRLNV